MSYFPKFKYVVVSKQRKILLQSIFAGCPKTTDSMCHKIVRSPIWLEEGN